MIRKTIIALIALVTIDIQASQCSVDFDPNIEELKYMNKKELIVLYCTAHIRNLSFELSDALFKGKNTTATENIKSCTRLKNNLIRVLKKDHNTFYVEKVWNEDCFKIIKDLNL